jgi:hypothetical protein
MFEIIDWAAISSAFLAASVFGIPIILLVIGLTYAAGDKFGLTGKWQFVAALVIGLVIAGGYQAGVGALGYTWFAWFSYAVYGLLMGLFASLLYDTVKDLLAKIIEKMLGNVDFGQG